MTNEEIDIRLRLLADYLPKHYEKVMSNDSFTPQMKIATELELLNMQMMAVSAMLGEIAKRLPEEK